MDLHCYECRKPIKSQDDIGGSAGFSYAAFPICIECAERP